MNTSVRARYASRGFSFVELLVTIIIAGIAFAALVPMFIGAQKAVAGDQLRNSALQLAQDKLEKVRSLDYDLITTANLQSSTFANSQFGTSVQWASGGGSERNFTVSYQVDLLPAGSQAGAESYKQVTITAVWVAPPSPPKPVQLSTMVSKQYAGPQIIRFDVGPDSILGEGSTIFTSGPVVLDAYIAPDDILSMNQAAIESDRGYVLFTITSLNGGQVTSGKVTTPLSGAPAHYQFTWDNLAPPKAEDGIYVLQAVAVAGFDSRAQGMPVSIALRQATNAPDAPTNLDALPGDSHVYLDWTAASAADVAMYEIWRSTDGVTFNKVGTVQKADPTNPNDKVPTSFEDKGVSNGVNYYYKVRAVDDEAPLALSSPFTAVKETMPYVAEDTDAPSVPSSLSALALAGKPTVRLSWAPSDDTGSPPSGLAGYIIERSPNGSSLWTTLQSMYQAVSYDDTSAGWSKIWWYRVQAVDRAANASAFAVAGPVTTAVMPARTITVTNNSNMQTYVWVQNAVSLAWYNQAGTWSTTRPGSGVWVKKNGNGQEVWTNLPPGIYNVSFLSSQTWAPANIVKTQVVDVSGGSGTATYP